jgi:hypothetical protein
VLTVKDCKTIAKLVSTEVVVSRKSVGKDKNGNPVYENVYQYNLIGGIEKELISILPQINKVLQSKNNASVAQLD